MLAYQCRNVCEGFVSRAARLMPVQNLIPPAVPIESTVIYVLASLLVRNGGLAGRSQRYFMRNRIRNIKQSQT
jgi:hypothetical protein